VQCLLLIAPAGYIASTLPLAFAGFRIYNNRMRITFDPAKRDKTLSERRIQHEESQ
jgi:hypothetical protein